MQYAMEMLIALVVIVGFAILCCGVNGFAKRQFKKLIPRRRVFGEV